MAENNTLPLPPNPYHAVLKKIYPWEDYNISIVMQWLYAQAQNTGFQGTFEDFKEHYGVYIDAKAYDGEYEIAPLPFISQILRTNKCLLTEDIIIEKIPYAETTNTAGGYTVTIG